MTAVALKNTNNTKEKVDREKVKKRISNMFHIRYSRIFVDATFCSTKISSETITFAMDRRWIRSSISNPPCTSIHCTIHRAPYVSVCPYMVLCDAVKRNFLFARNSHFPYRGGRDWTWIYSKSSLFITFNRECVCDMCVRLSRKRREEKKNKLKIISKKGKVKWIFSQATKHKN